MCRFLVDFYFTPLAKSFTLNKHETVAATPPSPSQHSLIILKFEFNCSNRSHLWVKYFCVSFQRWWNYSAAWIWFPVRINHTRTKTSQRSVVVLGDIRLAASGQKKKKVHVQQISLHFFLFPNMSRYTGNMKQERKWEGCMQDNPQHHNFYYQSRKTSNIKQSEATHCLTKHNILFVTPPNWSSVYSAVENGHWTRYSCSQWSRKQTGLGWLNEVSPGEVRGFTAGTNSGLRDGTV